MSVAASPFCAHKRLRTSCPDCRATAVPPAAPELRHYAPPKEEKPRRARTSADEEADETPAEPKALGPRGPGRPLMPTRQKPKKVGSRAEAEQAEPWWVKK